MDVSFEASWIELQAKSFLKKSTQEVVYHPQVFFMPGFPGVRDFFLQKIGGLVSWKRCEEIAKQLAPNIFQNHPRLMGEKLAEAFDILNPVGRGNSQNPNPKPKFRVYFVEPRGTWFPNKLQQEPTKLVQDCPDFSFQNQPENGLANHAQVKTLGFKGKLSLCRLIDLKPSKQFCAGLHQLYTCTQLKSTNFKPSGLHL